MKVEWVGEDFDISKITPISNHKYGCKTWGGLYTSPVNARKKWRHHLAQAYDLDFDTIPYIVLDIRDDARILEVHSYHDLLKLPLIPYFGWIGQPDWEKALQDYDALHITYEERGFEDVVTFGWDCDTIVIKNPNIIIL